MQKMHSFIAALAAQNHHLKILRKIKKYYRHMNYRSLPNEELER